MKIYNKAKFIRGIFVVVAIAAITHFAIDFVRYPECYSPTWKYQLQQDIERGDAEMIKYYEETYVANGRELFK